MDICGLGGRKTISTGDLIFKIGPLLNASGRMENLAAFTERFHALADARDFVMSPRITIDGRLSLCDITAQLLTDIKRLSPFGQENQVPVFYTLNVRDTRKFRRVGKENEHLRFDIVDDTTATAVNAIAFNMGQFYETITSKEPFHICYSIE